MFVKICGITSEDDALLAVALGADAIGFVFAPSPRQVAPQLAYDIVRRLPPGIMPVGVFRNEHPDRVVEIVQIAAPQGGPAPRHRDARRSPRASAAGSASSSRRSRPEATSWPGPTSGARTS